MSRAEKREAAARAAKDKKQKKLLIVLAPILLLMVAWQGPALLKGGGGATTTAAGATTLTSTAPAPTDPTGAAPTTAGGEVPVATPSGVGASLPDTDESVTAGEDQLVRFDRFLGKDPFQQQVDDTPAAAPPPSDPGTGSNGGGTVTPVPEDPGTEEPSAYSAATVDVNGVQETLSKGTPFPESDPLFKIVSISAGSAKIGLVSGSFSNGKETVTVKVGKTVTLVSQPDGVRYVIKLISTTKA
jgi:hypothetical protein